MGSNPTSSALLTCNDLRRIACHTYNKIYNKSLLSIRFLFVIDVGERRGFPCCSTRRTAISRPDLPVLGGIGQFSATFLDDSGFIATVARLTMSAFVPSLFAISRQTRATASSDTQNPKRRQEQKERAAVAMLGFVLKHQDDFCVAFLRAMCGYDSKGTSRWTVQLSMCEQVSRCRRRDEPTEVCVCIERGRASTA